MSKREGRKTTASSPELGPGRYNNTNEFGSDLKMITIGKKYDDSIPDSLGPGYYSPDHKLVKNSTP
jgi:hypothetical protein